MHAAEDGEREAYLPSGAVFFSQLTAPVSLGAWSPTGQILGKWLLQIPRAPRPPGNQAISSSLTLLLGVRRGGESSGSAVMLTGGRALPLGASEPRATCLFPSFLPVASGKFGGIFFCRKENQDTDPKGQGVTCRLDAHQPWGRHLKSSSRTPARGTLVTAFSHGSWRLFLFLLPTLFRAYL